MSAAHSTPLLELRGVSKRFGETRALRGVDLDGAYGEVHALVGENGAGKSTIMKILSGAVTKDEGEIRLDGQPVELVEPLAARRLGIHSVYQHFSLVPSLSVAENVMLGRRAGPARWWVDREGMRRAAQEVLQRIGFGSLDVRAPVSRLSVSQQQIVEIAKALVERPRVLMLDEPSATLSHEELRRLFALVRALTAEGTLVLYVSHRLDEVFEVADRITVLKDGATVATVLPAEVDERQLITMMAGRTVEELYPSTRGQPGAEVLQVSTLAREGAFTAVTLSLAEGEIVGLFGLVGSGRSEVARCIFGADTVSSGGMRLRGRPYRPQSPRAAVEAGVAYLTEDRQRDGLVLPLPLRDNVSLASLPALRRWGLLNRRRQDDQAAAKVAELRIRPPEVGRIVAHLSGGNQQKVVLARWLLTGARVLILDEPTRGVDVATKADLYRLMAGLAAKGVALLLISSELPEVLGMSDRVLVMRDGRIVAELPRAEATEETVLAWAVGVTT